MTIRYFFARLKSNKLLTIVGSLALCLIMVLFTIAVSIPSIFKTALVNQSSQMTGSSDLQLTIAPDRIDRFFGLYDLRNDEVITDNAEYVNGYFKTFIQIGKSGDNASDFCTLYAANYQEQNQYNPIKGEGVPDRIGKNHIIIGADYAKKAGIEKDDSVEISFGGRQIFFSVVCIAENIGLFYSPNTVFISSYALSRLIPLMPSTIVTHCFIKATNAESLEIIKQRLSTNHTGLSASAAVDDEWISNISKPIITPSIAIIIIAAIFCLISLIILLKFIFARDRQNFGILRSLGISRGRIIAITVLTGLLISLSALLISFLIILLWQYLFSASSILLIGYKISTLSYLLGMGIGFTLGMLSAIICGCEKKSVKQKNQLSGIFSNGWLIAIASLVLSVLAFLIISKLPYLGFAFILLALFGWIFALPEIIVPLYKLLYRTFKNIYTLRLKALSEKPSWKRFTIFFILGTLVVVTTMSISIGVRDKAEEKNNYPFDIMITEIKGYSDTLFENVINIEGVENAVKCCFNYGAGIKYNGNKINGNLMGFEENGFEYFNANFSKTKNYNGTGAVIGMSFAKMYFLNIGDEFIFVHGNRNITFTVAEILDSQYMLGAFILVDIKAISTQLRPYSEILVKASGDIAETINNINTTADAAVSVVSLKALGELTDSWYFELLWMLDLLCAIISILTGATAIIMITMRRLSSIDETKQLAPLGLIKSAELKHNILLIFIGLLPAVVFMPFLMLHITKASMPLFLMFGYGDEMIYSFPHILLMSVTVLAVVMLVEIVICRLIINRIPLLKTEKIK